jgi:GH25 family lysozyme M1 (1,4-beta-N-acetylmuramidase)
MTTITRKVLDISHHNDVTSWDDVKAAGIVGIVHKATEGSDYVDDCYASMRKDAIAAGLLWGAYHFATGSDEVVQAEHFLDVVGVDAATLYCLDWEDYGDNTMSLEQARTFMQLIDSAVGEGRCVLYSGNTAKEALGSEVDEFFGMHRLWVAQYSEAPVVQASWEREWLWQYSDGNVGPQPQGCPGVDGDVDTNSWDGSDAELAVEWAGDVRTARLPLLRAHAGAAGPARLHPRWDIPPEPRG